MIEITDIRDATEEEIQKFTKKQEKPEWQQGIVGDVYEQSREKTYGKEPAKETSDQNYDYWPDATNERRAHNRSRR